MHGLRVSCRGRQASLETRSSVVLCSSRVCAPAGIFILGDGALTLDDVAGRRLIPKKGQRIACAA